VSGDRRLDAAARDLRRELSGGAPAVLGPEVRELAELLLERERRRSLPERGDVEHELLSAVPDAAAVVTREGRVRASNAALDALSPTGRATGLKPLEIVRSADLDDAVRRALEGTPRRLELPLGRRTFLAHVAPLLRGEVLLLLRDVTDVKRVESTRRDFVANASHELRTPIAAIRAAAETLLAGAVGDPAEARGFVEIVARHAERLARLTQHLLDLSRLECGELRFEPAPVDAAAVAGQAIELLRDGAAQKGLVLESAVPASLVVRADVRALEQVLVNLIDNAVKYTPAGSVRILGEASGGAGVLTVADTGPGIERHHLPRIFERFYRVDPGRSREQGGTGLGLAIAKHLVQGMAGEISVESGPEGTRFSIRLPLEQPLGPSLGRQESATETSPTRRAHDTPIRENGSPR
jgi:two-component system phosphate regulon sensor histidine kinase PhoR